MKGQLIYSPFLDGNPIEEKTRSEQMKSELIWALEYAKSVIRTWHDMGTKGQEHLWLIYQQSPEMKKINAVLEKYQGQPTRDTVHD